MDPQQKPDDQITSSPEPTASVPDAGPAPASTTDVKPDPGSETQPEPKSDSTPPADPPAPAVSQSPVPVPPVTSQAVPHAGSSKKMLLPAIAAAVVVIIAAIVVTWFMYLSPAAQSKRLSSNFMHSITTGDVSKATDLSGDSSAKDFLTTSSKSVHGSYKLSQSKFTNEKGYYLYTLTGTTDKYARTIIQKDNGKRVVESFVFSNTALALVPTGASTSRSTKSTTQTATPASGTSGCLTESDFSDFANLSPLSPTQANGIWSQSYELYFNPNVATYASSPDAADPTVLYNAFKTFYVKDASKKFDVQLEALVNSSSPDEALANARNAKVQSDLETLSGIPASKITIEPINNYTLNSTATDAQFRSISVILTSADSCSTSK